MNHFNYLDSPYLVREDIKMAHREYWTTLASPGSWWTGKERTAIAREVRNATSCGFCQERKQALSPYSFSGEHHHSENSPDKAELSSLAIDAVHRIVTDQNRITQAYVEANSDAGFTEEQYVELAGIVVAVFSIDEFNRGLGLELEPLPSPSEGEPTHYRPSQAIRGTGFVSMIPPDGATGAESDLWDGRTANVLRALTLVPDALRDWTRLAAAQYLSMEGMANMIGQDDRSINRMQMELIAGRVSSYNECFY
ncbi:MAG TPA: hypothetical protein EYQ14_01725 [Gammaproteobacteria bacterium]|nr:hypothetical protein [Gammaproteobacteria bacterium]HIL97433.1 hypothetical protein [Pseudomonadales bacterium]